MADQNAPRSLLGPARRPLVWDVVLTRVVLYSFLGALLGQYTGRLDEPGMAVAVSHALLNGAVTALCVALTRFAWRRLARSEPRQDWTASNAHLLLTIGVGFACGMFVVLLFRSQVGVLCFTALTVLIVLFHVRAFFRRVARLLAPGEYASWKDVGALLEVWITLIAAFTLINVATGVIHVIAGDPSSFAASTELDDFAGYFYFTIVTMTTLGFGDIVPVSDGARLVVAFQCLTSYIMFALSVGIVTRGILPHSSETEPGSEAETDTETPPPTE